ncbi:MAG: alpha-L-rhamnosidase N-terminal domain-containing protein [Oscillospiraceae bacterium]|nr:alpha-L-rhamnosidase N-terminal domain-containing protein [Oscillospiraceae bacterium]
MTFTEVFSSAKWLALPEEHPSGLFRFRFDAQDVRSARLTIVGLGIFEALINGKPVSDQLFLPLNTDYSARPVPVGEVTAHRLYCPQFDVTSLLRDGENTLAVLVGPGWFSADYGPQKPFGENRVCFKLDLTDGAGERTLISDEHTECRKGFMTGDMHHGEHHDYTGYDDRWLTGEDMMAWSAPKILPPLITDYLFSDCPADKVSRTVTPVLIAHTDDGDLYDCGENISGIPVFESAGSFRVLFSERLEGDALEARHMHSMIFEASGCENIREIAPRFTWYAFRYFLVSGEAKVKEVRVIHTDLPVTSSFESSSPVLNWLYDTYIRTQLNNMHMGIPSDCPHIERCGYTGDGQLTCDAVMTMFDAEAFYRKWIGDIADCQDRISGHVQYTAPYVPCGGGPGGWGCAIVEVPWTYWKQYGGIAFAREMWNQMLHYFDYLDDHSENDLVISDQPGRWCLGDWCAPCEVLLPEPFVNNYFYLRSISRMIEMAPFTGREGDVPALLERKARLEKAVLDHYYDPDTGDFCGNVQGANAFAVDIGLGDERTYAHMRDHYRATGCYDTGIFGTDIVTRLLFERGDEDIAAALLMSEAEISFTTMMKNGATTLWEYWEKDRARSDDHPMFGAVVRYLFHYILGIRPDGEKLSIAPVFPEGLTWARGSRIVGGRKVTVSWKRENGAVTLQTSVADPED